MTNNNHDDLTALKLKNNNSIKNLKLTSLTDYIIYDLRTTN